MIIGLCIALVVLLCIFLYWQNNGIKTTNTEFTSKKIPPAFSGFKIVQISDLHNKLFSKNQSKLVQKVRDASPDIIVITGDLIDCHRPNIEAAMAFIWQAMQLSPVYYVPGNQESKSGLYAQLAPQLLQAGVIVLNNQSAQITREGEHITVLGVKDIEFLKKTKKSKPLNEFRAVLGDVCREKSGFTILLAHRPEYLELYADQTIDLVFSGHAHGGQIRLPVIGGLFAPGQGWNPKYTCGLYRQKKTALVVSRGLGNSEFPFHVFNRPEVVVLTLKSEQ